jgi:NAD(P)-dependent dehydrogenase (short-subunit alcohol dehydrogenase family)
MRMRDKVVAITGSGSGLGREGALLFASEGALVVTSDVVPGRAETVAKEVVAAAGQAVAIDADVRIEADMERLVGTAVEAFDRIDVMWANAGIPESGFGMQQFVDSKLDYWNNIIATNLTGIYLAWKHAAKQMIAQGGGGTLLATTSAAAFAAYLGFPDVYGQQGGRRWAGAGGLAGAGQVRHSGQRPVPRAWHVDQLRHAPGGRCARQIV